MPEILAYLNQRLIEQGSITAYIATLTAIQADGIPAWGRVLIFIGATIKFFMPG